MAAILPFLEGEGPELDGSFDDGTLNESALAGLGADHKDIDKSVVPSIATSHTALTRLQWLRSLLIKSLKGRSFHVEVRDDDVVIHLSESLSRNTVPWSRSGQDLKRVSLFSTNDKMRVPTFDLPSGVGALGGSCPGAMWAQSVVAPALLSKLQGEQYYAEQVIGDRIDARKAVCEMCYASGGTYAYASTQFNELVHMAFVRSMLIRDNASRDSTGLTPYDKLKALFVHAITKTLSWSPKDQSLVQEDGTRIKPIRVHSSGDFFSTQYAQLWLDIAADVQVIDPAIRLWAPTRTHVWKEFADFWRDAKIPSNFAIRASGYHVGDAAPAKVNDANFKGTSVLPLETSQAHLTGNKKYVNEMDGKLADHQCGVYTLGKGARSCAFAQGPNNRKGCRVCWVEPDKSVNYVAH